MSPRAIAVTQWFLAVFLLLPPLYAQTSVKGRIVFEGPPPPAETVGVKSDIPTCGTKKELQKLIVGEGQGIANAVVRIMGVETGLKPAPTKKTAEGVK